MNSGDEWIVRADVSISNIFKLRPEATHFEVNSNITSYTVKEWGQDTVGLLQDNDAAYLSEPNSTRLRFEDWKNNLSQNFDTKLENRFPKTRFNGNCILSRLGHKI